MKTPFTLCICIIVYENLHFMCKSNIGRGETPAHIRQVCFTENLGVNLTEFMKSFENDQKLLPLFLYNCGGFTNSQTMGNSFQTHTFRINKKELGRFCDFDFIYQKAKGIKENAYKSLSENEKLGIDSCIESAESVNDWFD